MAQNTKTNQAVFALSPDAGARLGVAPLNILIDMKTGKQTQFSGLNNGGFHAGFVNGAAIDSNTGILATDTELSAQVEFYDLQKQTVRSRNYHAPATRRSSTADMAWPMTRCTGSFS